MVRKLSIELTVSFMMDSQSLESAIVVNCLDYKVKVSFELNRGYISIKIANTVKELFKDQTSKPFKDQPANYCTNSSENKSNFKQPLRSLPSTPTLPNTQNQMHWHTTLKIFYPDIPIEDTSFKNYNKLFRDREKFTLMRKFSICFVSVGWNKRNCWFNFCF